MRTAALFTLRLLDLCIAFCTVLRDWVGAGVYRARNRLVRYLAKP